MKWTENEKENGMFTYVSNKILYANTDLISTWHRERLTKEQWQELFPEEES